MFVNVGDERIRSAAFGEDRRHTEPNTLRGTRNKATIPIGFCFLRNEPNLPFSGLFLPFPQIQLFESATLLNLPTVVFNQITAPVSSRKNNSPNKFLARSDI